MGASRLAAGAVALALGAAGCSSSDSTYTAVKQATTTGSTTATATTPADTAATTPDPLAGLPARERKALASLAGAQAALEQRGSAVANAGTAAGKVVQRISAGYNAPPGPSTPA